MTDLPKYETDKPTAYEWTDKAFDLLLAKKLHAEIVERPGGVKVAEARGDCPRCEHDVDFSQNLSAPLPGKAGGLGQSIITLPAPAEYATLTVRCDCNGSHPGRPEGVHRGCGILFSVEVLRP